jgi:hypothetical protein
MLFDPAFLELNNLTPLFLAGTPFGRGDKTPFGGKAGRQFVPRRLARRAFFVEQRG